MKKILLSLSMIVFVGVVVVGATGAFFSDTETSSGNIFTAGGIDLQISNESYAVDTEGVLVESPSNSWRFDDTIGLFFSFTDVKPADYGEDTIGIRVLDNDSWACVDVTLTLDDDATCNDPENEAEGDSCNNSIPSEFADGDLADDLSLLWWADDGDNVLEEDETVITNSKLGLAPFGVPVSITLADSIFNIWNPFAPTPLIGEEIYYIGKGWCVGDITVNPASQDGLTTEGPLSRGTTGFDCSGASVGNDAQTDSVEMTISFRAEQYRNNPDFTCSGALVSTTLFTEDFEGFDPTAFGGIGELIDNSDWDEEGGVRSAVALEQGVGDGNTTRVAGFDAGDNGGEEVLSTTLSLDASGHSDLRVDFDMLVAEDGIEPTTDIFTVEYSTGSGFVAVLTLTGTPLEDLDGAGWNHYTVLLPGDASDSNLDIRFELNGTAANDIIQIDNVVVGGTVTP